MIIHATHSEKLLQFVTSGFGARYNDGRNDNAAVPELADHIDASKLAHADVFAEPSGLPPGRGVEHITPLLPDAKPRLAPAELGGVNRQVTNLLKKQLIEPSTSPWGKVSPVLKKKDGTCEWWTTEL